MSELRVGLVAEGPTDAVLIEAALRAFLPRPFLLSLLQPEPTSPHLGAGWCGVFKWCRAHAARGALPLHTDPLFSQFHLLLLHLDADVAHKRYDDGGSAMVAMAAALPPLPCDLPCPPALDTQRALQARLLAWLGGPQVVTHRAVLCLPSKAIEAWLAAAILPPAHPILSGLSCDLRLEPKLAALPKSQRVDKSLRTYRSLAPALTRGWAQIKARCDDAGRFEAEVLANLPPPDP